MKIIIINGPNLNLLGKREPEIYGDKGFETFLEELKSKFPNVDISYFQSNVEGEIINTLHEVGFNFDGIIMNAGGYTHTSVAIADAIASIETQVMEVHISNVYKREDFRHHSMMAPNCVGVIAGLGLYSYEAALRWFINQ